MPFGCRGTMRAGPGRLQAESPGATPGRTGCSGSPARRERCVKLLLNDINDTKGLPPEWVSLRSPAMMRVHCQAFTLVIAVVFVVVLLGNSTVAGASAR